MTKFTPPKKIYEEIADLIKSQIEEGHWPPGHRLDSVEQLAKNYNVSRSAVREAMSALRALGYVDIRQGEGTFVAQFDSLNFSAQVANSLLMNEKQIRDMYEVRKVLEVGAAKLAAAHRTEEDLKELEDALQKMYEADIQGQTGEEADMAFHLAVAKATKNEVLIHFMQSVSEIMRDVLRDTRNVLLYKEDKAASLYKEHRRIYDAIRERRPDLAHDEMFFHLTNVEKSLQHYMEFKK